jgi:hypothetical protein
VRNVSALARWLQFRCMVGGADGYEAKIAVHRVDRLPKGDFERIAIRPDPERSPVIKTPPQMVEPAGDISLEILDASGKRVRSFTSAAPPVAEKPAREEASDDEEEGHVRAVPTRLEKAPGMHRFIWDLRYPGPLMNDTRH